MVDADPNTLMLVAAVPFAGGFRRAIGTIRRRREERNRLEARLKTGLRPGPGGSPAGKAPPPVRLSPKAEPAAAPRFTYVPKSIAAKAQELTADQQAEAQRIEDRLMELIRNDIHELALLLASKSDQQLLGRTEFEVRDRIQTIGVKAIETALAERRRGGNMSHA